MKEKIIFENSLHVNEVNAWKRMYFMRRFIGAESNKKVLYVHTPFCKSKCKYCVYSSNVPNSLEEVDSFVNDILPFQIKMYGDVFERVQFAQVYFGGGTPTILSPEQLKKIFDGIPSFDLIPNKCIESSPTTLTSEHIWLFERWKFNFISLGVQSLDDKVLKKYGRQTVAKERLASLCDEIRMTGIFLNLDLICYLDKGDIRDLPKFEDDIRYILENFHPSSVTIHQYYQSFFSTEKTVYLVELLKKIIKDYSDYSCVNSSLEMGLEEIVTDTFKQAEYRLVLNEHSDYSHYMWDKYATLPVSGYDILSIGYTSKCHTTSNVNKLIYIATNDTLVYSS